MGLFSKKEAASNGNVQDISVRETYAILAALRYWQYKGMSPDGKDSNLQLFQIVQIATDGGRVMLLSDAEIDALCIKINM